MNHTQQDLIQKEDQLNSDIENITIQQQNLAQDRKQLALDKQTFSKDMIALKEQHNTLAEQKQNAELGFAVEKQRALDEKRQALDELQAESLKKWLCCIKILKKELS